MISENQMNHKIVETFNFARLCVHCLWVSTALAVFSVFDKVAHRIAYFRRALSPAKAVLVGILLLGILAPGALYYREHARRLRQEHAYRSLALTSTSETNLLRESLENLMKEQARFKALLIESGYPIRDEDGTLTLKVVATGYTSSVRETDNTPHITASNTFTRPGIVALSRDLLEQYTPNAPFDFGDRILIKGMGEFVVEDSMHRRWRKRLDIWFPTRREAFQFGKRGLYISKLSRADGIAGVDPD